VDEQRLGNNRAALLVEANERLLVSALQARTDAVTTALALDEVSRNAELDAQSQGRARDALARLNASLEGRVAARTRELEQARDEALAAVRAKEQFLSNMSHEIRTPMHGMLGALDLLAASVLTPQQADYIRVAATSGEALLAIINEVLDFAKIGAGQLQMAREPIDVNAIARSVTTLFSASAQRKAIELRLVADPALAGWRLGDALRLRQVLLNLVGNAMKFTQQGRVVVTTRSVGEGAGERVAFEVADTGLGIDRSQHERIFEPFGQADEPALRRQGGTGLGLAISRQLVRAMGGELQVDSELGRGSSFHFALDLEHAPVLEPAVTVGPAPTAASVLAPCPGSRVMLVEDNSVNRLIGSAMLEAMGLEVVLAEQGEEALAKLATRPVAVVLMDCLMPVMDGYEATQRLREAERLNGWPRTPVIALTANVFSDDVERCLAAGMDAHLAKPYSIDQLRATIAPWIPGRSG